MTRSSSVREQVPRFDARDWTRIADNLRPARIEIDLGGLGLIDVVTAVIQRVDQGLAQRGQWIADPAANLAAVPLLLQMKRRQILQIRQAVTQLVREGAAKGAFLLHVAGPVRSKLYDLDLGASKPLVGSFEKKRSPAFRGAS